MAKRYTQKMFNITKHSQNANQNHNLLPSHICKNGYYQKKKKQELLVRSEKVILVHFWWECTLVQSLWKMTQRFLKKLKVKPSYEPGIYFWVFIWTKWTLNHKATCTPIFIAAWFTIATICNLSAHQWMNG